MNKKNLTVLVIANAVAIVLTLIMNGLSNSGIFPNTVGDLGNSRAIFFLPANYVFGIWGIIYTGVIGFSIYQARPVARQNGVVERVGWWFVISCIANISWLVLFLLDQVWLSTVAMLAILFSLVMIYQRLEIGQRKVDWQELWAAHIPFSVYLGWISVATVANFSTALYEVDQVTSFIGISADLWAVIMMSVAGVLGAAFLYFRRDFAYALVIVWALVGINARPFEGGVFDVLASLNAELVNTAALAVTAVVAVVLVARAGLQLQQRVQAA